MNPVLRRCGRTHCTGPRSERPCGVSAASLHAVPSTLLIPLAARAGGGQGLPWLDCHDDHAAGLLDCLAVDARPYLADRTTVVNVLWRTALLKAVGQAFFAQHPQALGVNLGCGLSSHFQWLDNGHNHWIDADLPEVATLRRELLPPASPRAGNATVDLSQPGWWQRLGLPGRDSACPVFLLCEGVLMYLEPAQAQAVLREFATQAPRGSALLLDTLSHLAVGRAQHHPSVGPTGAQFRWGLHRVDELTAPHPRLVLQALRSVAECYGWAGLAGEAWWQPWLGAPLYGMAHLTLRD